MLFGGNSKDNMSHRGSMGAEEQSRTVLRLGDFVIYSVIGLLLVAGVLYEADPGDGEHWPGFSWTIIIFMTGITFGAPIAWCNRYWRRSRFWLCLVALLALHIGGWIIGLNIWFTYEERFYAELVGLSVAIESFLLYVVLELVCGSKWLKRRTRNFSI
jgi:hypothetical protein